MSMLRDLLQRLQEFLLPERSGNGSTAYTQPVDVLLAVYQRISRLARQIESHARIAPYPHVAAQLRRIAQEKDEIVNRLKLIVESAHGSVREGLLPPATGKNHWQRLVRDLEDQREVDNILARYEFTLLAEVRGVTDFVNKIKGLHSRHRDILTDLIALADPQASQT